jgi:hypothetical protein
VLRLTSELYNKKINLKKIFILIFFFSPFLEFAVLTYNSKYGIQAMIYRVPEEPRNAPASRSCFHANAVPYRAPPPIRVSFSGHPPIHAPA